MAKLKDATWQAPVDTSPVNLAEDGVTFTKRVLRPMVLHYRGQKINLSESKLRSMVDAFKAKAYDTVPLLLDGPLDHGVQDVSGALRDPERYRGKATAMEYDPAGPDGPGVYTTLRAKSRKAAKAIRLNPDLGVSARIVPNYEDGDGRRFPFAIQHILATPVPRVTGLGSWHPVSLSMDDDREVIDLTGADIEEFTVPKKAKSEADEIDLSDADLQRLLLELAGEADEDEDDEVDDTDESDDDDSDDDEGAPVATQLSRKDRQAINLAESRAADALAQVSVMAAKAAEDRWRREALELAHAGVPQIFIDLAADTLSAPDASEEALDLAEDDDELALARTTVRSMLEGLKGAIDLSGPVGHGGESDPEGPLKALLADWSARSGD